MQLRVTTSVEPVLAPGQVLTREQVDHVIALRARVEAAVAAALEAVPPHAQG